MWSKVALYASVLSASIVEISAASPISLNCLYTTHDLITKNKSQGEVEFTIDVDENKFMYIHSMQVMDIPLLTEDMVYISTTKDDDEIFITSINRNTAEFKQRIKLELIDEFSTGRCAPIDLVPFPPATGTKRLF